ncbi:hypothetical protein QCI42_19855 [Bacillus fungorum]|uniref:hypothetical protein n=1 Tax=Bacillus fungorum TaxID=2039284 RepID=UPI0033957522
MDIPRAALQLNNAPIPGSGFEEQGEFTTNGGTAAGGGVIIQTPAGGSSILNVITQTTPGGFLPATTSPQANVSIRIIELA